MWGIKRETFIAAITLSNIWPIFIIFSLLHSEKNIRFRDKMSEK